MNKKVLIVVLLIAILLLGCSALNKIENSFQHDADLLRLEHLLYWTALVEEYYQKKGIYPFQDTLKDKNEIGLAKIITKQQRKYLSPGSSKYNKDIDNNKGGRFKEVPTAELVKEIETV